MKTTLALIRHNALTLYGKPINPILKPGASLNNLLFLLPLLIFFGVPVLSQTTSQEAKKLQRPKDSDVQDHDEFKNASKVKPVTKGKAVTNNIKKSLKSVDYVNVCSLNQIVARPGTADERPGGTGQDLA